MNQNRASATALLVALSVVRKGREHELSAISIALAHAALKMRGGGFQLLRWLALSNFGNQLLDWVERFFLPGLAAHHCQRKRAIAQQLQALEAGTCVCFLGVGFDALGFALAAKDASLRIAEFDHPATLALRQRTRVWQVHASELAHSRALNLPADATQLLNQLAPSPSVLVAEGLLMYLPPRALIRLLRQLAAHRDPPRLLFTALAPITPDGTGFSRASITTQRWLSWQREPFRWRCDAQRVEKLLNKFGYVVSMTWHSGFGEYLMDAEKRPTSAWHKRGRSSWNSTS